MRWDYGLSERHEKILALVTEEYIETAAPVGSRTISKKLKSSLSPATIRNVMADLEELGLLTQPHVSAGRVPTEEGFRYYIEKLLDPEPLSEETVELIESRLQKEEELGNWEVLLKTVTQLLSDLSGFPAVATAPKLRFERLVKVDFVPLSEEVILVVAVSASGFVIHRLIRTETHLQKEDLERLSELINSRIQGLTLEELRENLYFELQNERRFLEEILGALSEEDISEPFVEGINRLLDLPEFQDIERLKEALRAFEEKTLLLKLVERCLESKGPQVVIGEEVERCFFRRCGAVVGSYTFKDTPVGGVAVVGPIRMAYAKIIPLVEYTAKHLSKTLDKFSSKT